MMDQTETAFREDKAQVANGASALINDTATLLKDRADEALGRAQETFGKVKDTTLERLDQAQAFTREKPYAALGVAALIGLIVGHSLAAGRPRVIVLRDRRPGV